MSEANKTSMSEFIEKEVNAYADIRPDVALANAVNMLQQIEGQRITLLEENERLKMEIRNKKRKLENRKEELRQVHRGIKRLKGINAELVEACEMAFFYLAKKSVSMYRSQNEAKEIIRETKRNIKTYTTCKSFEWSDIENALFAALAKAKGER